MSDWSIDGPNEEQTRDVLRKIEILMEEPNLTRNFLVTLDWGIRLHDLEKKKKPWIFQQVKANDIENMYRFRKIFQHIPYDWIQNWIDRDKFETPAWTEENETLLNTYAEKIKIMRAAMPERQNFWPNLQDSYTDMYNRLTELYNISMRLYVNLQAYRESGIPNQKQKLYVDNEKDILTMQDLIIKSETTWKTDDKWLPIRYNHLSNLWLAQKDNRELKSNYPNPNIDIRRFIDSVAQDMQSQREDVFAKVVVTTVPPTTVETTKGKSPLRPLPPILKDSDVHGALAQLHLLGYKRVC
jgi:hypothetical protein